MEMRNFAIATLICAVLLGATWFSNGHPGWSRAAYDSCQLNGEGLDALPTVADLGEKNIDEFGTHHIWFSPEDGDLQDHVLYDRRRDNLNFNGLYRVTSPAGMWHFRFEGQTFDKETRRTGFYQVEWAGRSSPRDAGRYKIEVVENPAIAKTGPELSTVGDSITWWNDGRYLRCMMNNAGLSFTYIGSRVDVFGLHHEGEGGNSTSDIIARLPHIRPSKNYLLIAGANDEIDASLTIANLDQIAVALSTKKPGARVLISTLLPRFDDRTESNIEINKRLRKHQFSCAPQCQLIDLGRPLEASPKWRKLLNKDQLHPSYAGYRKLSTLIVTQIAHLFSNSNGS